MDILLALAQFLVNEILSVPAYLIGLITAIGLIALRKTAGQVIGSALKAVLGFLLIGAGATLVTASLTPLGVMIQGALGAQGVVPTNEAIAGIAQAEFGAQVAWLMILGFVVAILLARFTPLRYVFLTGHHLLFMATLITIVMASAGMPGPIVAVLGAPARPRPPRAPPHLRGRLDRDRALRDRRVRRRRCRRPVGRPAGQEPVHREHQGPRVAAVPARFDGGHRLVDGADVPGRGRHL